MAKTGPVCKFNDTIAAKIIELAEDGHTDQQIAEIIGFHPNTLVAWRKKNWAFATAMREAKINADSLVEASLFQRAIGYTHKETKVFYNQKEDKVVEHVIEKHYPPDPSSIIFWLKNRQPDRWRDAKEIDMILEMPTPVYEVIGEDAGKSGAGSEDKVSTDKGAASVSDESK